MFNDMDGIIGAWARKKTQLKEDLSLVVKFAHQKLSKYYADVTPTTGMLLFSACIPYPFWMLQSFCKWVKRMDIQPENMTSYTTHYQEVSLNYKENEYCAKHRCLPVTKPESVVSNNPLFTVMATRSGKSSYDRYDLSGVDEELTMQGNMAETTPGRSNPAAHLVTAARLNLNSLPD